jgi:hypothetical protein
MVQGPTTYRVLAADVVVLTREALAEITKSDVRFETAPASMPVIEEVPDTAAAEELPAAAAPAAEEADVEVAAEEAEEAEEA